MAGPVVKAGRELTWFTLELQDRLIAQCRLGMKPEWAARRCQVAPKALEYILEIGARKTDDSAPFRSFVGRWIAAEAELMEQKVTEWNAGDGAAYTFLVQRWPNVWGPKAKPSFDPLLKQDDDQAQDDMAQLRAILANPGDFGLLELFAEFGRLRPDGT